MAGFNDKRALLFLLSAIFLLGFASCSSTSKTTSTSTNASEASAASTLAVRNWLSSQSHAARSINVAGSISVDQDGSSQSASFEMKVKRLNESGDRRIDSLSVIVSGPFGIKVARFLASPQRYAFYDILHGETVSGETDQESLTKLTQLKGVSLAMMTDLVFGLLPSGDDIMPEDSTVLYERSTIQTLVIYRAHDNVTDVAELQGAMPEPGAVFAPTALTLRRFRRWNGTIHDPMNTTQPADLTISLSDHTLENGVLVPHHLEAKAGKNALSMDYTDVQVNPPSMTVRIKMP